MFNSIYTVFLMPHINSYIINIILNKHVYEPIDIAFSSIFKFCPIFYNKGLYPLDLKMENIIL